MSPRVIAVLSFVAAALFALAGVFSFVGGSTGTGWLYLVVAALFAVAGFLRGRGIAGRRPGGRSRRP